MAGFGTSFLSSAVKQTYAEVEIKKLFDYEVLRHGGRASPRNGIFANVDVYPDLPQKF